MKIARLRVKMCGMSRIEDINYAAQLGVDACGFILYPQSPRYLSLEKAQALAQKLPAFMNAVAVIVNPDQALVEQVLQTKAFHYLQFHGDESPQFCQQFNHPYIKAIAAESATVIEKALQDYHQAAAILVDTPAGDKRGGTGMPFDWQIVPKNPIKPIILAGGLDADNVNAAVQACNPYAVDVNSGIEVVPGVKDPGKMQAFIEALWGNT